MDSNKEKTKLLLQGSNCSNCDYRSEDEKSWCSKSKHEPIDSICLEYRRSTKLPELMKMMKLMTNETGLDMTSMMKQYVGANKGMFEMVLKLIQETEDIDASKGKN